MARQAQRLPEKTGGRMFLKAALAIVLVWLLLPREPELGTRMPQQSDAFYYVERVRLRILDAIVRVRADLKAHHHSM